ncbi:MAG TPA: hypothetical protein VGE52_21375 [Pirellulales bacterium]
MSLAGRGSRHPMFFVARLVVVFNNETERERGLAQNYSIEELQPYSEMPE